MWLGKAAITLALLMLALHSPRAQEAFVPDRVRAVVAAERAFARAAVEHNMRDAFLANLADSSIIFTPEAVNGQAFYRRLPPIPWQLRWQPAFAEAAQSGDLGFTTGPWRRSVTAADSPSVFGYYVSVWKKQTDGVWKVVIDMGVRLPAAAPWPESVEVPPARRTRLQPRMAKSLGALDSELGQSRRGAESLIARALPWVRVHRNGSIPQVGVGALRTALSRDGDTLTWQVRGADESAAGDLGYTWGTYEMGRSPMAGRGRYLRVWTRDADGDWMLLLDQMVSGAAG